MSVGLALLHRLLSEGRGVSALKEFNIDSTCFDPAEKKVYLFMESYQLEFGTTPKVETVEQETEVDFPNFPDEPLGYWVKGVERRAQSTLALNASKGLKEAVSRGDLGEAKSIARDLVAQMDKRSQSDRVRTLTDLAPGVLEAHDIRQHRGEFSGVPFGIDYLDRVTDGAQPGDTVAVVGRPSVGKSYLLFKMSLSGYDLSTRGVPLVVTLEMQDEQCARRLLALRTGVSATMIRLGRLSLWGRRRVEEGVHQLLEEGGRPFYLMQGGLTTTVEDLLVRVQELRPNALYVDGAYLLRTKGKSEARWERIADAAETLKMVAREFGIPVVATYQFNRRGPGLANIGGSDAIGQLASIVIGIEDEQASGHAVWSAAQYKTVKLLKGREGEKGTVRVLYDMERMRIEQEEVISGYDHASLGDSILMDDD